MLSLSCPLCGQLLDHRNVSCRTPKANDCWQSLLREYGWHTDGDDLTYGTTALDADFLTPVLFEGEPIKRTPRAVGYKVIGIMLTFNNRSDLELERRIRAAWCAFHKNAQVLCCKACPISKRILCFHSHCLSCSIMVCRVLEFKVRPIL